MNEEEIERKIREKISSDVKKLMEEYSVGSSNREFFVKILNTIENKK